MTSQLIPLAQLTMVHRLAAIYLYREFPEAGGLVSYGPTESDTSFAYRRVAYFVDQFCVESNPEACRSSSQRGLNL